MSRTPWCESFGMARPGVKKTACWSGTSFCVAHAITATDTLNVVTTRGVHRARTPRECLWDRVL